MYIDPELVTIPLAILAGLASFVSPCVLPLVPAYIGYLTGQATNTTSSQLAMVGAGAEGGEAAAVQSPSRWIVLLHGIAFVLGFTVLFVLLGISVGALGSLRLTILRNTNIIGWIGGTLLVVLGLHVMGVIRIPFLYYDTRKQIQPRHELGYLGSGLMGFAFSAGWSPCLGPFLAAMLTLGGTTGSIGRAAVLLTFYALGLGIPFLLAAVLLDRATGPMRKLQRHMKTIEIISGILLIGIGVLVFTGTVQRFSAAFANGTELTIMIDEWLVRLAGGGS